MATDIQQPADQIGQINKYDFHTETTAVFKSRKGIDTDIVREISAMKNEPDWMRDFRLEAFQIFE